MYEIIDDYQCADDDDSRNEILDVFLQKLWNTKNTIHKYKKQIKYSVSSDLKNSIADEFRKHESIEYIAYKSKTSNKDNWHLLRQKINNIYINMCDKDICIKKDVLNLLNTPRRLYYRYVKDDNICDLEELQRCISNALLEAKELAQKYRKQKLNISWKEYKEIISSFMFRIFNNYIPLEDYEDKNMISIDINFWMEDNYVVSYIGKSISGYMKNYQKEYFDIKRNKEYKQCSCGGLLEKFNGNNRVGYHYKCNQCRKPIYQPIGTKIIICVDCEKEVEVDSLSRIIRCNECFKIERQRIERDKKRKQRMSH